MTFGKGGLARLPGLDFGGKELKQLTQPDGKVLVSGGANAVVLRVLPDGTLDPTFGTGGVAAHGGELFQSLALALQPDGKVLVSGLDEANALVVPVLRLLPDGKLDPSFGQGGRAEVGLLNHENYGVVELAVQPDGAIVGAGRGSRDLGCEGALMVRLLPTGAPDPTFGVPAGSEVEGPGFATFSSGDLAAMPDGDGCEEDTVVHLRVNRDGSFDVLGWAKNHLRAPVDEDAFWVKLAPNGLLDATFGTAGFAFFDTANQAVPPRPDNVTSQAAPTKAGGFFINDLPARVSQWDHWAVLKLTAEATLDPTFGSQGVARYEMPPQGPLQYRPLFDIVPLPDDSVIVVGWTYATGRPLFDRDGDIALVQHLLPDGSRDLDFGKGGELSFDLGLAELHPTGGALQPNGSVLLQVIGHLEEPFFFENYAGLVRILPPAMPAAARPRAD